MAIPTPQTQFTRDILGNYVCNTLAEALAWLAVLQGPTLAQLLYVTNLWEDSHDGLQYAIQMAIRYRSRLVLLHVVEQEEPKRSDHEWLSAYRRILRNLLPESASDLPVEPVLRIEVSKHPTGRILQVADEITASLVVMDVSPEESWATHLRDRVYEIVSWANCPVLTVRTKTRP
jgi:nucleotide-binding universal stress UspA family protein